MGTLYIVKVYFVASRDNHYSHLNADVFISPTVIMTSAIEINVAAGVIFKSVCQKASQSNIILRKIGLEFTKSSSF